MYIVKTVEYFYQKEALSRQKDIFGMRELLRKIPTVSKMEKKFILALDAMKPELKSLKKLIINGTKKKQ